MREGGEGKGVVGVDRRISLGKGPMVIADAEVIDQAYVCERCGRIIQPADQSGCAIAKDMSGELPHVFDRWAR